MKHSRSYQDRRWQKKRLEIMDRDGFTCRGLDCKNPTNPKIPLNVHHLAYWNGYERWEYPDHMLITLCSNCHKAEHVPDRQLEFVEMCPAMIQFPPPESELLAA